LPRAQLPDLEPDAHDVRRPRANGSGKSGSGRFLRGRTTQVSKTDPNDAHGLAQLVRVGWYKEVAVKSIGSRRLRTLLTSRAQLVNMRRDLATKIRGLLKTFGLVVGKVGERAYEDRVRELLAGEPGLERAVHAPLASAI
jgi:transposase